MSRRALHVVEGGHGDQRPDLFGWLAWLRGRLDPGWRAGEWDDELLLFTGDLASSHTAAWACRTPGCPTATRRPSGRCESCRRDRASLALPWATFDADPPARLRRPLQRGGCAVPGCEGELHYAGLCYRHARSREKNRSEPITAFLARARPLTRGVECRVAGCGRESVTRRRLCRFHGHRLQLSLATVMGPPDCQRLGTTR